MISLATLGGGGSCGMGSVLGTVRILTPLVAHAPPRPSRLPSVCVCLCPSPSGAGVQPFCWRSDIARLAPLSVCILL